jgi:predicted DNA-binding ribbon-helix-helix protein
MYIITQRIKMHRTQIYLEDYLIKDLKEISKNLKISMSQFIREALKKEIEKYKKNNLENFLDNLTHLESFKNVDPIEYVDNIRNKSRIIK